MKRSEVAHVIQVANASAQDGEVVIIGSPPCGRRFTWRGRAAGFFDAMYGI